MMMIVAAVTVNTFLLPHYQDASLESCVNMENETIRFNKKKLSVDEWHR